MTIYYKVYGVAFKNAKAPIEQCKYELFIFLGIPNFNPNSGRGCGTANFRAPLSL